MTTSTQQEPSVWWLRMACLFFFAGLSCYTPLLAAHLQWLGFDLQEIGIINLIASTGAALGLLLAATWTPRYGHRSNLAVAVLMAAFCGAGLILVPRLNERFDGRSGMERPVAEILCRPEGSALFFRKCGDTCELDAVARTELSVSDCQFEPQSRLPVHFIDWINRFALTNINGGKGSDGAEDDLSEPERGDLPQKIPVQPSGFEDQFHPSDVETDETLLPGQSGSPPSGVAPYEYDYDENHRLDDVQEIERRRKKRQSIPLMDDAGQLPPTLQIDDEFEIAEKADLPYTSSPHICFSSYSSSTTTCHVFTGTNHLFRFNTSFYSGITHNGQCFYSLNYDDVDNQILSELRCRSNKPNHQVRCRAEGMKLRASVTRNGTSTCHGRAADSNYHLVFWLYLIFRTCGEMAIIATVLLLRIVTLSEDHEGAVSGSSWMTPKRSSLVLWWTWALFGLVAMAPLAGWIADVVSFGIAFLLGSVMLGLTAFCIALSPNALPTRPHPMLEATLASIEEEAEDSSGVTPPLYRIRGRDLRAILSDGTAVLILLFMSLLGMAAAVNPTIFYWYLLELGSTRLMLGASVTAQWLPAAPLVLLLSGWLWKRCGHRYIFIIGLLLYSIRFLGYTMLEQYVWIVVIETLEPLCSLWMLLTAAARIERLECRYRDVGIGRDRWHSWKVNTWALVILFHYSIGRALGGLVSSLAAHHFGLVRVFIGAALICLFVAACWFLWIHLKSPCQSRRRKNFNKTSDNTSPSSPKEIAEPPRHRNEAEQERKQKLLRSSPV